MLRQHLYIPPESPDPVYIHLLYASFFCLSFVGISFIHEGLLPLLPDFLLITTCHPQAWRRWLLKGQWALLDLSSRIIVHRILSNRSTNVSSGSPEGQGCDYTFYRSSLLSGLLTLPSHHLIVTAPKAAPDLPISNHFFLICIRSSKGLSLINSSFTYAKKLSSAHSRNVLDCLYPPVLPLQQIRQLKFPRRSEACEHKASLTCLKKGLTYFCLIRQPAHKIH